MTTSTTLTRLFQLAHRTIGSLSRMQAIADQEARINAALNLVPEHVRSSPSEIAHGIAGYKLVDFPTQRITGVFNIEFKYRVALFNWLIVTINAYKGCERLGYLRLITVWNDLFSPEEREEHDLEFVSHVMSGATTKFKEETFEFTLYANYMVDWLVAEYQETPKTAKDKMQGKRRARRAADRIRARLTKRRRGPRQLAITLK